MSDRLSEIEARLQAATPGPWKAIDSDQGHPAGSEWEVYAPRVKDDLDTGWVCEQSELANSEDGGIAFSGVGGRSDAELIAHAPEDIATLLAMVREQAATIARVEKALPGCANYVSDDCARYLRDINSPYTAEGYCLPCKIRAALAGDQPGAD